ncbi:ABC transporter permease [Flexithrix dorotheae]|uniref:ABC transporter permease n=1 Tax=Flexithrix dorotheae TaxID=70993 RepID=UPI000373D3A9|nr:ABC transporter permease [Flexithrix dorotheae]
MLKNYLTIAFRNIFRQKVFSAINILGLGIGISCCLLIFAFVKDELSYDTFNEKFDRIYRINYLATTGVELARIPPPINQHLSTTFPEVENSVRAYPRNLSIKIKDKSNPENELEFEEERIFFVDSGFQDIFTMEVLSGDEKSFFKEPFTAVINEEISQKYFGDENPIGKILMLPYNQQFKVVGLVKDFPSNSHIHFNILLPYDNMFDLEPENARDRMRNNLAQNWVISHSYNFVLLKEGATPDNINNGFEALVNTHAPEQLRLGQKFILFPLSDIHLKSEASLEPEQQGNYQYIMVFISIALATLIIAIFNFINLSTAQSTRRAREVGVRKVLGARKKQLFWQFLGESFLIAFFGFLVAGVINSFALPEINELTNKELSLDIFYEWDILMLSFGIFLLAGILGGSYPAIIVARLRTTLTLKGKITEVSKSKITLRRILVVFQFVISIILITGTILIFNQLNFLINRPLGFEKEGIITVPLFSANLNGVFGGIDGPFRAKMNAFEEELSQIPGVKATTISSSLIGLGAVSRMTRYEGLDPDKTEFYPSYSVDYDFISTYGLEIIEGRDFDKNAGTDHLDAFIINETAAINFGWESPEKAIGKKIELEGKIGYVIGVLKDFHYISLRNPIGAMLMHVSVPFFNSFSIKLEQKNLPETIASINSTWTKHFPDKVFEYDFLDENLKMLYEEDEKLGKIIGIFASLAIIVSCLGSYGLILFNARQREKEIGVRKVLGAGLSKIIILLFREFTILFIIGMIVSIPVTYYFGNNWLDDFNYRVDIGAGTFVSSAVLTISIIWITISYQAVKAALINPIKCLRDE